MRRIKLVVAVAAVMAAMLVAAAPAMADDFNLDEEDFRFHDDGVFVFDDNDRDGRHHDNGRRDRRRDRR